MTTETTAAPGSDTNTQAAPATTTTTTAEPTTATTAAPATAPAAPETPVEYAFDLPEGVELDEKGATALTEFAKAKNLSQEDVKDLTALYAERVQAQANAFKDMVTGWETEVKKDPEIGGDKLATTITVAKTAIDKYGSPALLGLLDSSKMGSHPEVIKFLHKVGLTLKEDTVVTGKPPVAPAKSFYDNSNMAP